MHKVNRKKAPQDDVEHRPPDHVDDAIEVAARLIYLPQDHGVNAMYLHAALPFTKRMKTSSSAGSSRSSSRIFCVISIGLPAAITFPRCKKIMRLHIRSTTSMLCEVYRIVV